MMALKATDRRIRKTRDKLRLILIEMLKKRDLKDISVLELAEQADVNRGTFYLHYKDIYDLFEQIENDVLDNFQTIVRQQDLGTTGFRENLMLSAFYFLIDNADVIAVILRADETLFLNRMLNVVKPRTEAEWRQFFPAGNPDLFEYCFTFLTSACVGVIRQWFYAGRHESPEFMARLLMQLINSSLTGLP